MPPACRSTREAVVVGGHEPEGLRRPPETPFRRGGRLGGAAPPVAVRRETSDVPRLRRPAAGSPTLVTSARERRSRGSAARPRSDRDGSPGARHHRRRRNPDDQGAGPPHGRQGGACSLLRAASERGGDVVGRGEHVRVQEGAGRGSTWNPGAMPPPGVGCHVGPPLGPFAAGARVPRRPRRSWLRALEPAGRVVRARGRLQEQGDATRANADPARRGARVRSRMAMAPAGRRRSRAWPRPGRQREARPCRCGRSAESRAEP